MFDQLSRWEVIVVILGPAFHGKSTISLSLKKQLQDKLTLLIGGDLVKKESTSNSQLGRRMSKVIKKGGLLKNSLVTKVLTRELQGLTCRKLLLLEGYPRSMESLRYMYKTLLPIKRKVLIFKIDRISDPELVRRIKLSRFTCVDCGSTVLPEERCITCGSKEQVTRDTDLNLALSMVEEQSKIFNTNVWKKVSTRYKVVRLSSLDLGENLKNITREVESLFLGSSMAERVAVNR